MNYLLAIDQGTTSTTVLITNLNGEVIAQDSQEFPQYFPEEGFVEHDGDDIKASVRTAALCALAKAKINPKHIVGIGITNQRETLAIFDKNNKCAIPLIVWQCRRSTAICEQLKTEGKADFIREKTGLHLDPYFTASKLSWVFKNHPQLLEETKKGKWLIGTIDTFLSHWLSGGLLHITDPSNASRTMLMDIDTCSWSEALLDIFSVPATCLPSIRNTSEIYGKTCGLDFLPDGIPIAALVGDQQASLFGQACFNQGDAKATFGTGCFIMLNTGNKSIRSKSGLITSVAYMIDNKTTYCLEGSAFIAGAAIAFLKDAFGLIESASEVESLAKQVKDSLGLCFVPALCGLGAPYWLPHARGVLSGLSRGTTKAHIARATLEGVALQNTDIMAAMAKDCVAPMLLKVDGGASSNDLLMQMQADLLGIRCIRSNNVQKTAMGAIYLAGLSLGVFNNVYELADNNTFDDEFSPNQDRKWADAAISAFKLALSKI